MATKIRDLGRDVLSAILDLLDATSMLHLVMTGNTVLSNKIYHSARSFYHRYPPAATILWPKCFHRFHALEHVSFRCTEEYAYSVAYGVDILALPPTLRTLDMGFNNSLLCLIELPPLANTEYQFVPRLRPELPAKFKNLKCLKWNDDLQAETANWDYSHFVKDLYRWPLDLMPWPYRLRELTLKQAFTMFDLRALSIKLGKGERATQKTLPVSLTHLEISGGASYLGDLFALLPRHLERLVIDDQYLNRNKLKVLKHDLAPLGLLKHLTDLKLFLHTGKNDTMLLLPRSLRKLQIHLKNAELESFAHFPPNLTYLGLSFETLHSTTTGQSLTADRGRSLRTRLPPNFHPSMRTSIVTKLPQLLETLSTEFMLLLDPADWDALPRGIKNFCSERFYGAGLYLKLEDEPYVANLPRHLEHMGISTLKCSALHAASLPPNLRSLSFCLTASNLPISLAYGSAEELYAIHALNVSILDALSQHCPWLNCLVLEVDETFDLTLLSHLTTPLKTLSLHTTTRRSRNTLEALIMSKREALKAMQMPPRCLEQLESFTFDENTLMVYQYALPRLLPTLTHLKELKHDSDAVFGSKSTRFLFPSAWLSVLPPSLVHFTASLDRLDADTFKSIPPTVRHIDAICTPDANSFANWHDLLFLPRTLHYVALPLPLGFEYPVYENSDTSDDDISEPVQNVEILQFIKTIAARYFKNIIISIGLDDNGYPMFLSKRDHEPLQALLAYEWHARSASPHLQQSLDDSSLMQVCEEGNDDRLLVRGRKWKRIR